MIVGAWSVLCVCVYVSASPLLFVFVFVFLFIIIFSLCLHRVNLGALCCLVLLLLCFVQSASNIQIETEGEHIVYSTSFTGFAKESDNIEHAQDLAAV